MDIPGYNYEMQQVTEFFLYPYLKEECIHFLNKQTRDEILEQIVKMIHSAQLIENPEEFLSAVFSREKLVSTGIGLGFAVPHAKLSNFSDFFVSIARIEGNGVEWGSIDKMPVKIVFLIGGPDSKPNRYLKILSTITEIVRDDELRQALFRAQHPKEILRLLENF